MWRLVLWSRLVLPRLHRRKKGGCRDDRNGVKPEHRRMISRGRIFLAHAMRSEDRDCSRSSNQWDIENTPIVCQHRGPSAYAISKCCCAVCRVRARLVGAVVTRDVCGCTPILAGGMAVSFKKNNKLTRPLIAVRTFRVTSLSLEETLS